MDQIKLQLQCIDDCARILKMKMVGKHPTRNQMIRFVKKYAPCIDSYTIHRVHDGVPFEDGSPFTYFQYLTLAFKFHSNFSASNTIIEISTLPFNEIADILNIQDNEPLDAYIEDDAIEDETV